MLRSIGEEARRDIGPSHFLLITDGIPTYGCSEIGCLNEALGPVWPSEDTLQILVVGNKMDETLLKAIAPAGRGIVIKVPLYQKRVSKQTEMMAERCADAWQLLLAPVGSSYDLKLVGTGEEISDFLLFSFTLSVICKRIDFRVHIAPLHQFDFTVPYSEDICECPPIDVKSGIVPLVLEHQHRGVGAEHSVAHRRLHHGLFEPLSFLRVGRLLSSRLQIGQIGRTSFWRLRSGAN